MVNIIWVIFIVVGILYSFFTGNISVINDEIIESGNRAFDLVFEMMPLLVVWMGLLKIAEVSGLVKRLSSLMSPILSKLFPSISSDNEAIGYIASNVAANMIGLGSAATPFGLKAMEKLQEVNPKKDRASTSMITFLVLNTGGVTIVPTTIIALRNSYGSVNPSIIIPTCIIATFTSCITGLIVDYFIRRKNGNS